MEVLSDFSTKFRLEVHASKNDKWIIHKLCLADREEQYSLIKNFDNEDLKEIRKGHLDILSTGNG